MRSRTTEQFRKQLRALPENVQRQAKKAYQQILLFDPGNSFAQTNLALALMDTGPPDLDLLEKAIGLLESASSGPTTLPAIHKDLAIAYVQKRDLLQSAWRHEEASAMVGRAELAIQAYLALRPADETVKLLLAQTPGAD